MAVFARPATWNYDIELFRAAVADEDQLEALMGAIARDDQQLLVAESDEQPAAFAWLQAEKDTVTLLRLHVADDREAQPLVRCLLDRVESDHAPAMRRLEATVDAISGIEDDTLRQLGFDRQDSLWQKLS